jgi:hypothetical protein
MTSLVSHRVHRREPRSFERGSSSKISPIAIAVLMLTSKVCQVNSAYIGVAVRQRMNAVLSYAARRLVST